MAFNTRDPFHSVEHASQQHRSPMPTLDNMSERTVAVDHSPTGSPRELFPKKLQSFDHSDHERRLVSQDSTYPYTTRQNFHQPRNHKPSTATTASNYSGPFAEHGVGIDRSGTADLREKPANRALQWPQMRRWLREPFSEFMGTFVLVMFGDGAVAQVTLSADQNGSYQSISWGFGLGIMLGAYVAGQSGAHMNPAVTLANCVYRQFPWRKLPIYALAQLLGGLCAAAVIYGNYLEAITAFEGGSNIRTVPGASDHATAGIFATYPTDFMSTVGSFFSEVTGTALLMFMIYALQDNNNYGAGKHFVPLGLFFTMFGIASCFGWQTSFAINPARDMGPRLLTSMVGYGSAVYTASRYYFWIPLVAPTCGALLGGFLYDLLLFTGRSPINTPYLGAYRLIPGMRHKYDGVRFDYPEPKADDSPV